MMTDRTRAELRLALLELRRIEACVATLAVGLALLESGGIPTAPDAQTMRALNGALTRVSDRLAQSLAEASQPSA